MPAIIRPRNADGSLGEPEKFGQGETDVEKIARLEEEKMLLLSGMMEMSALAAVQQQSIEEQNSAIMELSMLVAMTTGGVE